MRWSRIRIVTATTHVVTCVRAPCTTYHDAKKKQMRRPRDRLETNSRFEFRATMALTSCDDRKCTDCGRAATGPVAARVRHRPSAISIRPTTSKQYQ